MARFSVEKQYFLENVGMMLRAGIALPAIFATIADEAQSTRMKQVASQIGKNMEDGQSLWKSLSTLKIFPPYIISLIRIGEESGQLPQNMAVVALEQEKQRIFQAQLRSALMYPLFVLFMTVVVGTGTAWFILPKLAVTFSQLRIQLPITTKILIALGLILQAHGLIIVPCVVIGFAMSVYVIFFMPRTKYIGQSILRVIPGVGRLIKEVEIARMGFLLGSLLEAGMTAPSAFLSLSRATETRRYQLLYQCVAESVGEGDSISKSLHAASHSARAVPLHIQQLISAAEQSGQLANTMKRIGTSYEEKANLTSKNLASLIEPFLLVIVWLGVLGVALGVILPIYQLIGGLESAK